MWFTDFIILGKGFDFYNVILLFYTYNTDKPIAPGLQFSNTTTDGITVELISPDSTITEYEVTISNNGHHIQNIVTDQQSVIFSGLNSNTNYTVEAYGRNCANISSDVTTSENCTSKRY